MVCDRPAAGPLETAPRLLGMPLYASPVEGERWPGRKNKHTLFSGSTYKSIRCCRYCAVDMSRPDFETKLFYGFSFDISDVGQACFLLQPAAAYSLDKSSFVLYARIVRIKYVVLFVTNFR